MAEYCAGINGYQPAADHYKGKQFLYDHQLYPGGEYHYAQRGFQAEPAQQESQVAYQRIWRKRVLSCAFKSVLARLATFLTKLSEQKSTYALIERKCLIRSEERRGGKECVSTCR